MINVFNIISNVNILLLATLVLFLVLFILYYLY